MNTIRCLLIDDEPPAIELLQKYCGIIDQLEVVGTSYSAVKAFDLLKQKEDIDLLFLDIRMPILNGIDFIKTLEQPPAIIFTTAYREYALDGYDLNIIDYLLKPIAFDRFLRAIDRYRDRSKPLNPSPNPPAATSNAVLVNVNRTVHRILFEDIRYLESLKDYTRIHLCDRQLVIKGNIGKVLPMLPAEQFLRIPRSYAVALRCVQSYNHSELHLAGVNLPVGLNYREELLARMAAL